MARDEGITIYTDGGADPNPGVGGWGAVVLLGGKVTELSGGESESTNNRMELTAAIRALESLSERSKVALFTDSQYLKNGVTKWMDAWVRRNWQRKDGELKNVDLWQRLAELRDAHEIDWRWVKGHSGVRYNERADELATAAIRRQKRKSKGAGSSVSSAVASAPSRVVALSPADYTMSLRVRCGEGRGSWATVIRRDDNVATLSGAHGRTTANRIEVYAAVVGLSSLPERSTVNVRVASDYLRHGATRWLEGWKKRGWRTADGGAVKNADLWRRLETAMLARTVTYSESSEVDVATGEQLDTLLDGAQGVPAKEPS